jgi:hypothetical protein
MMWPWKRRGPIEPRRVAVSTGAMELETAKEILAEVFAARPGEVEEMIQRRLDERWQDDRGPEENIRQEKRGEKLWPATFCVGE